MKEVSARPNQSTLEFQALETENTQLKEELTAVRIKNAGLRDENVSIKKQVNPTHAYYNGSCISKDTDDPSWSTSFKTRSTQKTSLALEALWKTLFVLYLYLIGTFNSNVNSRATVLERPKVLAPGLYAMTPKYIPPQKRNNREANTPLPKEREVASEKPHHMIAPGSSRDSSNDMVHNYYLEEAKKQTHEIGRNSKTSLILSARS
ncbi:hypothetical protein Tco_1538653 [Tanacetum coccineum]